MIPRECKRLIEVDFPLGGVNIACAYENNIKTRINSGHISLLHTWWARRPLAACRSVLMGLLLPDPGDTHCPPEFKEKARQLLSQVPGTPRGFAGKPGDKKGSADDYLRKALLDFIAEFANWDHSTNELYLKTARGLIKAAHPEETPLVVDPFAGGGSIPLEALRLGCEAFASDLNPVAWLLLKIELEWVPRHRSKLLDLFLNWSNWVLKEMEQRLTPYYPVDKEGRKPLAYLWARTIRCEGHCGATIPLIRNLWLSQQRQRKKAMKISYSVNNPNPHLDLFCPGKDNQVGSGTIAKFKVRCSNPSCNQPIPKAIVQEQLRKQKGGATNSILIAVARENPNGRGKDYYPPTQEDLYSIHDADQRAKSLVYKMPPSPPGGDTGFRPRAYGITEWGDVLTHRQRFSRWIIHQIIEEALHQAGATIKDPDLHTALAACLYLAFSDNSQYHTSLCVWLSEGIKSIFIQGSGVPMRADFVEGSPLSPNCEGLAYSIDSITSALRGLLAVDWSPSSPLLANALDQLLPDQSAPIVFTDPPYANQIPYAHLSDFFFGWLKLGLEKRLPHAFGLHETEKITELTENRAVADGGVHDRQWYEDKMTQAFKNLRQALTDDGIAAIVFAHKETDRWEALVSALIGAGWRVSGSWPILTERQQRMRGQGYSALASSVHIVCRPRAPEADVGDWAEVRAEMDRKVRAWMDRLIKEGIRGADAIFACIGPALEVYSRYSRVETPAGQAVPLGGDPEAFEPQERGFLAYIFETVSREALRQVLGGADTEGFEEDARLTALFLWTLQSTRTNGNGGNGVPTPASEEVDGDEEPEEGETKPKKAKGGFALPFDVFIRLTRPMGIHYQNWEERIVTIEKGLVNLVPVADRQEALLGETADFEPMALTRRSPQRTLFEMPEPVALAANPRRGPALAPEDLTTLDRVHKAMLLFAAGQTLTLQRLLEEERLAGKRFERLALSLTALYPPKTPERRWLEGVQAMMKMR